VPYHIFLRRWAALAIATLFPLTIFGAAGDLYVGDLASGIFRITPAGVTTRFVSGFDAYGIAFNAQGDTFSASSSAKKIFRIAADGTVSDFVTGLGDPLDLVADQTGNLYVADYTQAAVYKIDPSGVKSQFAAGIPHADGLAFDPSGNLFVTSFLEGKVTRVSPTGAETTLATGLTGPVGIACDAAGNIFVAERDASRISRFTPAGAKSTYSTAVFRPYGLAFDVGGTLYASDQVAGAVYKVAPDGSKTLFATFAGQGGFMAFEPANGILRNVSTRARILTGENVMIGGFIIGGTGTKTVCVRAIGPSLTAAGVIDALMDPVLELHDSTGAVIANNDDWRATQESQIQASMLAPTDDRESALIMDLAPGSYTAIASGKSDTTGVGLVEVYDLGGTGTTLANISTRSFVDAGDDVLIGGFIVGLGNGAEVIVRGIGPSLASAGIANPLPDPVVTLFDSNGVIMANNDNWKDTQQIAIEGTTLPPTNDAEAAVITSLAPGAYTAIVSGKNGATGVGLVEVFNL